MMGEEKFFFLINGDGDRALEDAGQSLPEPVLRMMIEKMTFSGLDRWEGAKDQDPGAGVKTGGIGCLTVFMVINLSIYPVLWWKEVGGFSTEIKQTSTTVL